jgi:hypothetical protein
MVMTAGSRIPCLRQVLGWHLSVEASMHPGAHGFGWFFRYLTFYSFSLQFATLGLSCLSDIAREVRNHLILSQSRGAAAENVADRLHGGL